MGVSINWRRLLSGAGIEYVERGANVKRGELNIKCPWCGHSDPSHHLGINPETSIWACWRNKNHRGRSPLRLLMRLLHVDYETAREIAGLGSSYSDPEGFDSIKGKLFSRAGEADEVPAVEPPKMRSEFRAICDNWPTKRFWEYLVQERGFHEQDIPFLCTEYGLRCALTGTYAGRVIIPYYFGGVCVTWTARATQTRAELRYLDLSVDQSYLPPKAILYNFDAAAEGGRVLVVVEGPMDVLKLDYYGKAYGVRSVGLSTNNMSEAQQFLIEELASRFNSVVVMHDNADRLDVVRSLELRQLIATVRNAVISPVPYGYKDAGEMPPGRVLAYARKVSAEVGRAA